MTNTSDTDDRGIGELLREVGARDEPSAEITQAVQAAVYAEWRAEVQERTRARRRRVFAIAASVAVVAVSATVGTILLAPKPTIVANIAHVDGRLLVASGEAALAPRAAGEAIRTGDMLHTDAASRASIAIADGLSARLDRDTTLRVTAQDTFVLDTGALYIDAPSQAGNAHPLVIETHAGSVRHVGTQYEVRTYPGDITVSVREGRVLIESAGGRIPGEAGERVQITMNGRATRTRLSPQDPHWQWVTQAAPPFDIENRPLAEFLTWAARETGRKLTYASPQVRGVAEQVRLRGSIAGLDPDKALATVLSTTQLRQRATEDETLAIDLAEEPSR